MDFTEVYKHLPYIDDSVYKTAAVQLLFVFYNRRLLYGPDVSIALLESIEELFKVSSTAIKWNELKYLYLC